MTIAGLGCRKNVAVEAVIAALDATLARHRLRRSDLGALATMALKKDEPALVEAARRLGLPLRIVRGTEPAGAAGDAPTRSSASMAVAGVASVSEAAALAVAGPGSRLLGPRMIVGAVTCAIAIAGERP